MNNELKYSGKTLEQMTSSELEEQYDMNNKRIIGNGAFLGAVTGISLFAFPPVAVATLGVGAFRTYFIKRNNKLIEEEAHDRGMVLKKTKKR